MNLAMRKLAMLEKEMIVREENQKLYGYVTAPQERELKEKITKLLNQVR